MASDRGSKTPTSTSDRPPKRMAYGVDRWDTEITNQLRELGTDGAKWVLRVALARMMNTPTMTIIEALSVGLEESEGERGR